MKDYTAVMMASMVVLVSLLVVYLSTLIKAIKISRRI